MTRLLDKLEKHLGYIMITSAKCNWNLFVKSWKRPSVFLPS